MPTHDRCVGKRCYQEAHKPELPAEATSTTRSPALLLQRGLLHFCTSCDDRDFRCVGIRELQARRPGDVRLSFTSHAGPSTGGGSATPAATARSGPGCALRTPASTTSSSARPGRGRVIFGSARPAGAPASAPAEAGSEGSAGRWPPPSAAFDFSGAPIAARLAALSVEAGRVRRLPAAVLSAWLSIAGIPLPGDSAELRAVWLAVMARRSYELVLLGRARAAGAPPRPREAAAAARPRSLPAARVGGVLPGDDPPVGWDDPRTAAAVRRVFGAVAPARRAGKRPRAAGATPGAKPGAKRRRRRCYRCGERGHIRPDCPQNSGSSGSSSAGSA